MWFYRLIIKLYWIFARTISPVNSKACRFVKGRKNLFYQLKGNIPEDKPVIWFHCASLGEFEQARPLIEAWKERFPRDFILLTFFSPSGYEVRKDYKLAGYVSYLPMDTKKNARQFIEIVNPSIVIFIKYEFWLHYIDILHRKDIPIYLVSGIFRKKQHFFQWYGGIFRKRLHKFRHFFVQNNTSSALLDSLGISRHTLSGDTRFDRVSAISRNAPSFTELEAFCKGALVIVAGSSWPPDEKLFTEQLTRQAGPKLKIIFAPHQVEQTHIRQLIRRLPEETLLWSRINSMQTDKANILIIDTIGILPFIYQYADIAYIGGGFGKGIHNTLEAATYNIPVVFGPHYRQFREAKDLINKGGAFSINNRSSFNSCMENLIHDNQHRLHAGKIAGNYIKANTGATSLIMETLLMSGKKKNH
ncbi:MAG: glycosyltransferase N-terminal domain-containing protein [Bacteroidales bacterium]